MRAVVSDVSAFAHLVDNIYVSVCLDEHRNDLVCARACRMVKGSAVELLPRIIITTNPNPASATTTFNMQ